MTLSIGLSQAVDRKPLEDFGTNVSLRARLAERQARLDPTRGQMRSLDGTGEEWLHPLIRDAGFSSGVGYRELAIALRASIASGDLPVGTKLPPQRELARLLSIGRTTVVAAYNLLRAESLIVMRQGAGTWVVRRP